jgi:hypothetical protein
VHKTPKPAAGDGRPWGNCSADDGGNASPITSPTLHVEKILSGVKLPTTDWRTPVELPDLRRAGIIAIDTEENDEGLRVGRSSAWLWHGGSAEPSRQQPPPG